MLIESNFPLVEINYDGDTALHVAAQRGNLENVMLLCEGGHDINVRNKSMMSPLYLSILNEHLDCA